MALVGNRNQAGGCEKVDFQISIAALTDKRKRKAIERRLRAEEED